MKYFLLDSMLVGAKNTDLMVTLVQFSMGVPHLTDSLFSLLIWGTDLHCDSRLCLDPSDGDQGYK